MWAAEGRRVVESEGAGRAPCEHPVQHQRVDVDVEIHRPTEALDDGDTAAAWIGETLGACPGTQVPLDRLEVVPHDRVQDRRARVSRRVLGQAHAVGARVSHANTTGETQVDAASPLDVRDRFAGDCFCIRATATAVQESRTSADCVGLEVTLDHGRHRFPGVVVVPARRP